MNKTLEKILEDELFENQTFEGEGSLSIKHTSEGTKMPTTLIGNTIQDGEPSPEKPVELRHLADDINMFDEQWTNSSTTSTSTNFIPVFKDEYYIYSQDNEGSAVNYHFYETKESTVQSIYADANTGFTPPSNGFIKLSKRLIPEGTKCKLQKEKKGDITPYSSYGKGTVKINNHNKNYLNVPKSFNFTQTKTIAVNMPVGTYQITYLDMSYSGENFPVLKFIQNNKVINLGSGGKNQSITIDTDETSVQFYSNGYDWNGSTGIEATINELMISKDGGQYEEHKEKDVVVQTAPLRSLPNGVCDEKDGSKTIRRVGEVILDGVTAGKKITYPVKGTYGWAFGIAMSNMKKKDYPEYHLYEALLCSHYKPGNGDQNSKNSYDGLIRQGSGSSGNRIWIYEKLSNIKATDTNEAMNEYNQWLTEQYAKGTPVTVSYELYEPVVEEDAENKLANITSYNGETNIICTSEMPCGLKVDAKISKIKKLEEQINAQGGV